MNQSSERRQHQRLYFMWPLWYGYDESGELKPGQIQDLSEQGLSFVTSSDHCPNVGDHVFTRFSYPLEDESRFDMSSYRDWCEVTRVDSWHFDKHRVTIRLFHPLSLSADVEEETTLKV